MGLVHSCSFGEGSGRGIRNVAIGVVGVLGVAFGIDVYSQRYEV
jgi:hypothetical protein